MGSSSEKRKIATKKSNHVALTPPAASKVAPPPPPTPVIVPFPCTARSSSASGTCSKLLVGGSPVLTDASCMDVDKPGNMPSKPAGGDIQTMAVCGKAPVTSGSSSCIAGGKKVARTGDTVATNVMTPQQKMAQMTGILTQGVGMASGGSGGGGAAKPSGSPTSAKPADTDDGAAAGASSAPKAPACEHDPVAVLSGFVVDSDTDIVLPGAIALEWTRHYSSQRFREKGMLGRGGWVLGLEQWVAPGESMLKVRLDDGRSAYFEPIGGGEQSFHRRERLELHCESKDGAHHYRLYDLTSRLWREYAPQVPGGLARLTRIADAYGNAISLSYEGARLSRVIDTAGRELRLLHNDDGYVTRAEVWARRPRTAEEIAQGTPPEEPSLQAWIDYAYDDDGCLCQVTDALGFSDEYRYDLSRRRVRYTLKNGQSFCYEHDEEHGRCIKTWGDGGLHSGDFDRREDHEIYTHGHDEPRRYVGTADGYTLLEETYDKSYQRKREYDDDRYLGVEAHRRKM